MRDLLHIRPEICLSADDAIIKTGPVITSRLCAALMIVIDVLARRVPIQAPQIRGDPRTARFSVEENGAGHLRGVIARRCSNRWFARHSNQPNLRGANVTEWAA